MSDPRELPSAADSNPASPVSAGANSSDATDAPSAPAPRLSQLPFADELLSKKSRAWVQQQMTVAAGDPASTAMPGQPRNSPTGAMEAPLADELLSEQSRAWVHQQQQVAITPSSDPPPRLPDSSQPKIAGYHIGARIGRGGMGTVYECARDGSTDRLAIKIITSGRNAAEEERRRFMSEIGMLLRLHHPNISRLRDFGHDGTIAWFVMDFIAGRSFSAWLAEAKPDYLAIATLLGHAARAVAHAHRQGIIHRDLNPANLMVVDEGHPVIMDFGLARDLASDEVLTISGMAVGTPPYMSPEQTLGTKGTLSIRTDVWGMGAILYHGLTGKAPFDGASNHEIFNAINDSDPVWPRVVNPTVPVDLERMALRCLQRLPADRYPDLDALAKDLEQFSAGKRVGVRLPGFFTRLQRRVKKRPLPWILAAALVLVGCGFLGYAAVEQIRRVAGWSQVVDTTFMNDQTLPAGLAPRDGFFQPLAVSVMADQRGLGPALSVAASATPSAADLPGWWWFQTSGLQGGVRLDLDLDLPVNDSLEIAINASDVKPREPWHHPAGWVVKVQSADVLSLAVAYQDAPGPLQVDNGFLCERAPGSVGRLHVTIEVRGTSCTVAVAGSAPITVNEPLALGGSNRGAIGVRFYNPQNRLQHMRVERLAAAELVSPLAGPDALLRHGRSAEAIAEYRLVAADHPRSGIGGAALLRAFAERCRQPEQDDPLRNELYAALRARGPGPLLDEADRIRAVALWAGGQPDLAIGVVHDLIKRRPDLNPVQTFLGDRTWAVSPAVGSELMRLLATTPNSVGVSLSELGLVDLAPLAGRRAWSVNIPGNRITDLAPVANSGCTYLNAARNRISELTPLSAMGSLVRLNLSDNLISDLSPLAVLSALRILDVNSNQINSLAGLPTGLTDLNVSHNPLTSLVGLQVAALQRLSIAQTGISDVTPLRAATQLSTLDIGETLVIDAGPLQQLPITWLRAANSSVLDPATISIKGLRRLQLSGGPLAVPERISPQVWQSLQQVEIATPITAWPTIQAPELHELQLPNCQLAEVGGLPALTALRRLEMRGNQLRSIEGLSTLVNLTRLDVRNNHLTTLGALLSKPPGVFLVVGNPLSVETCHELIAVGQRTQRLDLLWQGASTLLEVHGNTQALRDVAISYAGHRYAVFFAGERLTAAAARDLAARLGGRLAVIPDALMNQRLASSLASDSDPWCGLILRNAQLLNADAATVSYHAAMPPVSFRGYRGLPADGGHVVLLDNATWGLALNDLSGGAVIEWPSDL